MSVEQQVDPSRAFVCVVCQGAVGVEYIIREMMFGTRDEFRYVLCSECGALQLQNPPTDWSHYYRTDYYAQNVAPVRTGIRRLLREWRNAGVFLDHPHLLARILARRNPYPIAGAQNWFKGLSLDFNTRILDVGCGDGMIVQDLSTAGFRNVLGIDPFLPADREVGAGGRLRKAHVSELVDKFDLIMLHHSLEHAPNQKETMRAVAGLLAPGATCIVRIPIASSWAWQHYQTNWVQADAPRHFCLHSLDSVGRLAEQCGLTVRRIDFDSIGLQIAGSELYARDIPLTRLGSEFTEQEREQFERRAAQMNADRIGDQIVCYLSSTADPPTR